MPYEKEAEEDEQDRSQPSANRERAAEPQPKSHTKRQGE